MSCLNKKISEYAQVVNLMRAHGIDFVTSEKCLDFIRAEARVEALREAADRAAGVFLELAKETIAETKDIPEYAKIELENWISESIIRLRAAITQEAGK